MATEIKQEVYDMINGMPMGAIVAKIRDDTKMTDEEMRMLSDHTTRMLDSMRKDPAIAKMKIHQAVIIVVAAATVLLDQMITLVEPNVPDHLN